MKFTLQIATIIEFEKFYKTERSSPGTGVNGYNGDDQTTTSAELDQPYGLYIHNDHVYFTDSANRRVRMILPNGTIKTIVGKEFRGCNERVIVETERPEGIFVDESGIYTTFGIYGKIRKIDWNGSISIIVDRTGVNEYSGDVPFNFARYPHIGPKKKPIKSFPKSYHDIIISTTC